MHVQHITMQAMFVGLSKLQLTFGLKELLRAVWLRHAAQSTMITELKQFQL